MTNWYIGCSGFHYKHWRGTFYPEKLAKSKWLDYYCQFYNTLELNVTFYRFPQLSFLKSWYDKTPSDFKFAVKAPKAITHFKQFNGVTDLISDFYNTTREGLNTKLGCILFQMPPKFTFTPERLDKILKNMDPSFLNVVEFRHESWWKEEIYQALSDKNISFCGMSHPTLPKSIISNTPLLYYRLHGEQDLYASDYSEFQLENLVKQINEKPFIEDAYIFFNNDIHTYAVYNSLTLKKIALG